MSTTTVTMPWGIEFSFVTEKCIGFNRYFEKCEGEITREFNSMKDMQRSISDLQRRGGLARVI